MGYLRNQSRPFLEALAAHIEYVAVAKDECVAGVGSALFIVMKGVAAKGGVIYTSGASHGLPQRVNAAPSQSHPPIAPQPRPTSAPRAPSDHAPTDLAGAVFGDDVVLTSPKLRDTRPARAITYLELGCVSRASLDEVMAHFPAASNDLHAAANVMALQRAVMMIAAQVVATKDVVAGRRGKRSVDGYVMPSLQAALDSNCFRSEAAVDLHFLRSGEALSEGLGLINNGGGYRALVADESGRMTVVNEDGTPIEGLAGKRRSTEERLAAIETDVASTSGGIATLREESARTRESVERLAQLLDGALRTGTLAPPSQPSQPSQPLQSSLPSQPSHPSQPGGGSQTGLKTFVRSLTTPRVHSTPRVGAAPPNTTPASTVSLPPPSRSSAPTEAIEQPPLLAPPSTAKPAPPPVAALPSPAALPAPSSPRHLKLDTQAILGGGNGHGCGGHGGAGPPPPSTRHQETCAMLGELTRSVANLHYSLDAIFDSSLTVFDEPEDAATARGQQPSAGPPGTSSTVADRIGQPAPPPPAIASARHNETRSMVEGVARSVAQLQRKLDAIFDDVERPSPWYGQPPEPRTQGLFSEPLLERLDNLRGNLASYTC